MSQLSTKRDASYITKKNAAVVVNFGYSLAQSNVNAGTASFMPFQTRDNFSADLLQERNLGCYTCTQSSNVTAQGAGQAFDSNIVPVQNGTFPTSGGVNNAGSS